MLEQGETDYLVSLLPDGTRDLLEKRLNRSLAREELANLVARTSSTRSLCDSVVFRALVLDSLPNLKLLELADRLGISWTAEAIDADPTYLFSGLDWNARRIGLLAGFLGAEAAAAGDQAVAPSMTTVSPDRALFDHQLRAAYEVERRLSHAPHRCVLHLPTGVGKTRTAMFLVAKYLIDNPNDVVIWLAHGLELLNQAAEEFEVAWKSYGNAPMPLYRLWGGQAVNIDEISSGLIVASLDSAAAVYRKKPSRLDDLALRTGFVVFDEAHQCVAPTYQDVTSTLVMSGRTRLLGLTATPGRTWGNLADDAELASIFGHQKVMLSLPGYPNPIDGLTEQGYLAAATFRVMEISGHQVPLVTSSARYDGLDDYSGEVLEAITDAAEYNLAVLSEAAQLAMKHKRIMLFAATVSQAKLLNAVLVAEGFQSFVVAGDTPASERSAAIRIFKSTRPGTIFLINYGVLTTGFDAPTASAAIIARPTQSLVLYSQMVGRVLRGRRAGGTDECEIVTVVDPQLPGFGDIALAFTNWEDVWTT